MRQARIKPSEVDTFMHLSVKNVMARARGEAAVAKRRLTRALASDPAVSRPEIYCFKRLREIV